jgi:AcrR family transcriptional regulator
MRKRIIEKHNLQRKTVLEVAAKMFSERGFGGTSLGDVAENLEISRPALYYYFSSKQEILSSLVDEISVKSKKAIEEIRGNTVDPVTKLHEMTYRQLLFVMRNKLPYMVVVKTEEDLVSKTRKLNLEAKKAVLEAFQSVIQEGIDKGHFRKIDSAVAALGIIGMCSWCALWFKEDGRLSDTQVADQLTQMALASVLESNGTDGMRQEIASIVKGLEAAIGDLNRIQKIY